jgi:hypothetical protein
MSNRSTRWLRPLLLAGLAATTSIAAHAARFVTEVITTAPPAPQVEVVGVAPHTGWVWEPGYYAWRENRHVWVAGEWVAPRPGYRWEPHVWVKEGAGWRLRAGEWIKVR